MNQWFPNIGQQAVISRRRKANKMSPTIASVWYLDRVLGWGTEKKNLGRTKQSPWVQEIELRILEEDREAKIPKAVYQKYAERAPETEEGPFQVLSWVLSTACLCGDCLKLQKKSPHMNMIWQKNFWYSFKTGNNQRSQQPEERNSTIHRASIRLSTQKAIA